MTDWFGVQIIPDRGAVHVDYLGSEIINLTVRDVSKGEGEPLSSGQILLDAEVIGNNTEGWQASVGFSAVSTKPGDTHQIPLKIEAGATITNPTVEVQVNAYYQARVGTDFETNMTVLAVAQPNPVLTMRFEGTFPEFQPDEQKRVPVVVSNRDYYPEMISFEFVAPEGWTISPPSSIQLGPGETETVYFDIKAPQDPWFRLNPSSEIVLVTARTMTNEGGQYTMGIPTPISGAFLPGWVVPHILLFLLGAAVLTRRKTRDAREHRLEKGKPSFPGLPPEKEARFEALKVSEPEKAEKMEGRLKELYKKRKEAWAAVYKERKEKEKERRKLEKERHDAILKKKREREKQRRKLEKKRKKKLEKLRKQKERQARDLEKKREKAEKRAQKAREEQEEELAEEFERKREEREKRLEELEERRAELAKAREEQRRKELEAKKRRLEELKQAREQDETEDAEGDSPWWKP